ncbi:hypothetical protein MBCUT_07890 [Methanobrevibacter cuticularis]|uniref:Pseudomurein-binding repeat protein n=1 Tax=Methanobrevibacter cuticularis TaxID=47311 RepID=A0A166CSL7_9EURY|nr:pseudomurein-binding repeat-containing protein [Methanobrevibacter cuticularis]KZX16487.1 hypothetical protein MBCUT_07890 [Methanobrevibacter cuticularis]
MATRKIKHSVFILIVIMAVFSSLSILSAADNNASMNLSSENNNQESIATLSIASEENASSNVNNSNSTNNSTQNNTNGSTVSPNSSTNGGPKNLSQNNIIKAAKSINSYAVKNKRLPNYVTISGYKFSMPEFLYLMSKTIYNKQKNIKSNIIVKYNVKNPTKTSGSWVRGKIYSVYYYKYATTLIKYVDKNKKVPNHVLTAGGNKLQYQTLIFLFSKILSKTSSKLPYYVSIDIKRADPLNMYVPTYTRDTYFASQFPTTILGKNNLGYVQFLGAIGNLNSKVKIAYIIGVHPLENQAHNSLYNNLIANSNKLKYKYYIYKITVTSNPSSYDQGRMNGQLLSQKYILPHAKKAKYNLVVDVHSNQGTREGGNYKKTNFLFAPLNNAKSKVIANKIIKNIPGLSYYYPASQTSPPYCTNPLVQSGTKTLVYETYKYESLAITNKYIKQLIVQIDKLAL